MTQQLSPWLETAYGWSYGESGWNSGMDSNLLKFSVMFDRNVDSIVGSLPSAVNGQVHYNTSDNRLYFAVGTTYFSTLVPKWFTVIVRSTGATWQFNGTSLSQIDSIASIDTRLDSLEITASSLGTAAFQDSNYFATQAALDIVEASSEAYTDSFKASLSDTVDLSKGVALVGGAGRFVNTIAELRTLPKTGASRVFVAGYWVKYDGGGGNYTLDTSDTTSLDNGGTTIVGADGGRWKLSFTGKVSVRQFGAKGNNVQDDQPYIQAALDAMKVVRVPVGTYKLGSSILYKGDGYSLEGESMNSTILTSTGTHSLIRNPDSATITRLFCEVKNLRLDASAIGGNIVLDWKSCQFGTLDRVWVTGQNVVGCTAIRMLAEWAITECTYNAISECYIGLCATGINFGDGANNNTVRESRIQPSFTGGVAIFLSATVAGRVSSNSILNCGFEYPGNVSNGVNIFSNCENIRVENCRFESLNNAIIIGVTGNSKIIAGPLDNYFSSNTAKINISGGARSAVSNVIGHASTSTAATVVNVAGNPFNINVVRNAVGVYTFTFVEQPADTGYSVSVSSSTALTRLTEKSTVSFTITTEDAVGVDTDAALLDVSVLANR